MDDTTHIWGPVHFRPRVEIKEVCVTYGPADVLDLGPMVAGRSQHGLCFLAFADEGAQARLARCLPGAALTQCPGPVPLDGPLVAHGTDFQRRVWATVCAVPAGATATYGDISRMVGGSPRAVGQALKANPLAVAVPCHRIVRADGSVEDYAWGPARKRALLAAEGADV